MSQGKRRVISLAQVCVANLVTLVVLYALAEGIGDRFWLTVLLAYAPPLLYTPVTLLLTLIALARRDRVALAWCAAAGVLLLPILGVHISYPPPVGSGPTLRVLTFNIEHGQESVARVSETIRRAAPDVAMLDEVNGYAKKAPDPLPGLVAALPEYRIVRAGEVAIVTRLPLQGTRAVPMVGGRQMLAATLTWQGKPLTVFAVHLSTAATGESLSLHRGGFPGYLARTAEARRQQVTRILSEVETVSGPCIVAGDFNTPPRGPLYHHLAGRMQDSFAAAGSGTGWSFPSNHPYLRIDYIWLNGNGIRAARAAVLPEHSSDHRPLLTVCAPAP